MALTLTRTLRVTPSALRILSVFAGWTYASRNSGPATTTRTWSQQNLVGHSHTSAEVRMLVVHPEVYQGN